MTLRRLLSEVRRLVAELPRCPSCSCVLAAATPSAAVPIAEGYRLPDELADLLASATDDERRALAELLNSALASQGDAWRMIDSQEAGGSRPAVPAL
jgi:hypothetical protein